MADRYLHFSGVNEAAYNGWFGLDYLRTASWTDMFNAANYNYFSIAGIVIVAVAVAVVGFVYVDPL